MTAATSGSSAEPVQSGALPSVVLSGVSKVYPGRDGGPVSPATPARRGDRPDTLALDGVSFAVTPGEGVAVLGVRESGRSTVIRLIAGVIAADAGTVGVRGHVAGAIAAGVGFSPKLPVRNNIIISAAMLGMSRREAKDRLLEMAELARVEDLLDVQLGNLLGPERRRLGMAIAVSVRTDVFLVDDSLLVGDQQLDSVILERLRNRCESGMSLVFAGRPKTSGLKQLCSRGLVLDDGRLIQDAPLKQAVRFMRDHRRRDD